jgi:hypothetical protein
MWPLIAAAVMAVGSTLARQQQIGAIRRAQAGYQSAETERQKRFTNENLTKFAGSEANAKRANQETRLGDEVEKRKLNYDAVRRDFNPNTDMLSGQQDAPDAVKNSIVKSVGDQLEAQRGEGQRKAALDAWGDLQLGNARLNQRNADHIGMLGRFARSSADILPLELQAAQSRGGGWGGLADLLQMGSTLTSAYAGTGGTFSDLGDKIGNLFKATPVGASGPAGFTGASPILY